LDEGGPSGDLSQSDKVREILPWLKISSILDPENVQTYTVTAFWLRTRMHKVAEAEEVLHEGLRHNPANPQLLYELGRVYYENYDDVKRARSVWEAALRCWTKEKPDVPEPVRLKQNNENFDDRFMFEQIHARLAQLEEAQGNYDAAIAHLRQAQRASLTAGDIQKHIDALETKKAKL